MPLNTFSDNPIDMCADDSTITATGKAVEHVETAVSKDLDDITMWCDSNRMALNGEKPR